MPFQQVIHWHYVFIVLFLFQIFTANSCLLHYTAIVLPRMLVLTVRKKTINTSEIRLAFLLRR